MMAKIAKRTAAAILAAACIITGVQVPWISITAHAEPTEAEMLKYVKDTYDEEFNSISPDSSLYGISQNTPGDYYIPEEALLVHIDANGHRSYFASDGVNKWPLEFFYYDRSNPDNPNNYTSFTSDGITAQVTKHPKKVAESVNDEFATDPDIIIPSPPKATKIEMSQDYGSFQFVSGSDDGYATGKDTTYITSKAFDGAGRVAKLVIRSTKITSISKNALCEDNNYKLDIKKGIKIYLPKSKFNKYKSMLLKCYGVKQAKPKFYTLDKWDGKLGKWLGKKYLLWLEGDGWRDVMKADRIEALKGTDLEGSKSVLDR